MRFRAIALSIPVLLSPAAGATAQPVQETVSSNEVVYETAPVTLEGNELFRVRGVSAYPAAQRAQAIAESVRSVAADESVPVSSLRIVEDVDRSVILAGSRPLLNVFEGDAALEGVSRKLHTQVLVKKIGEAMTQYRADRQADKLWNGAKRAAIATAILCVVIFLLRRLFRAIHAAMERGVGAKLDNLQRKSFQLISAERIWNLLKNSVGAIHVASFAILVFFYLNYVLVLFPWTRAVGNGLFALIMDPLRILGAGFLEKLPDLVFIFVLAVLVRYGLKLLKLFFEAIERGDIRFAGFELEWAMPTYKLARLLAIIFAVIVAYPYIPGSDSPAFKGVSLFLGVVFSLGSSSFFSNILAGYTMTYRRVFKVGDRIRIGDINGVVSEMRLLVTHVRTIKNEEIIVPNSTILTSDVMNFNTYAKNRGLILHTSLRVGYAVSWRQVEEMLLGAAGRTEGVLKEPRPFVLQKELGEFGVKYELNAYCDTPHAMAELYAALHRNVLDAFNEQGVQIMTPAYEGDPDTPKVVPQGKDRRS